MNNGFWYQKTDGSSGYSGYSGSSYQSAISGSGDPYKPNHHFITKVLNWLGKHLMIILAIIIAISAFFLLSTIFKGCDKPDNSYKETLKARDEIIHIYEQRIAIDSVRINELTRDQEYHEKRDSVWQYLLFKNQVSHSQIDKKIYETIPKTIDRLRGHADSIRRAFSEFPAD